MEEEKEERKRSEEEKKTVAMKRGKKGERSLDKKGEELLMKI